MMQFCIGENARIYNGHCSIGLQHHPVQRSDEHRKFAGAI